MSKRANILKNPGAKYLSYDSSCFNQQYPFANNPLFVKLSYTAISYSALLVFALYSLMNMSIKVLLILRDMPGTGRVVQSLFFLHFL